MKPKRPSAKAAKPQAGKRPATRAVSSRDRADAVKQKQGSARVDRGREETKTVSKPQQSKAAVKTAARPAAAEPAEFKIQSERFTKAMEFFHARDLKKARELFERASDGPNREMAFAAKTHQRMCEQRLERQSVKLESPEDYYNYGVALTNQGQYAEARKNLEQALKLREADHYHYALALCLGLAGDIEGAAKHLSKAIALEPGNRIAARNDADFAGLLHHLALQTLVRGA